MSQQTAMQKAIELIKKKEKYENVHISAGLNMAIEILTSLLPVERKGMEDAYDEGKKEQVDNCHSNGKGDIYFTSEKFGSDYFAQTYLSAAPVTEQSDEDYVKSFYPDAIIMSDYNPMYGAGFAIRSKLECIGWNR